MTAPLKPDECERRWESTHWVCDRCERLWSAPLACTGWLPTACVEQSALKAQDADHD